jgi:hypothetical protein
MTKEDLSKPAYTLTVDELLNIFRETFSAFLISNPVATNTQEKRPPIKGIHAISKYIGVSPSRGQKIKNDGLLPYFQNGRIVLFDPDEVDKVMHTFKKAK